VHQGPDSDIMLGDIAHNLSPENWFENVANNSSRTQDIRFWNSFTAVLGHSTESVIMLSAAEQNHAKEINKVILCWASQTKRC
jgi:hypothetical protein